MTAPNVGPQDSRVGEIRDAVPQCRAALDTVVEMLPRVRSATRDEGILAEAIAEMCAAYRKSLDRLDYLLREHARLAAEVATLSEAHDDALRCPWCDGTGGVPTGGAPDVNGYEPERACDCGDGTIAGAFNRLTSALSTARAALGEAETRIKELEADWRSERVFVDAMDRLVDTFLTDAKTPDRAENEAVATLWSEFATVESQVIAYRADREYLLDIKSCLVCGHDRALVIIHAPSGVGVCGQCAAAAFRSEPNAE